MKTEYTVDPRRPFIVHFSKAEDYETFKNEYRPDAGFYITKSGDNYRLFSNSHYYYANPFYEDYENQSGIIGISVGKGFPIDQLKTIEVQLNSVRVIGLRAEHLCRKGLSRRPIAVNGAKELWEAVTAKFYENKALKVSGKVKGVQEDKDARKNHLDFLEKHKSIIEEEERFNRQNLFSFKYNGFKSVLQNTDDGVVYKFNIGETNKKFSAKTSVKVFDESGQISFSASVVAFEAPFLYLKFKYKKDVSITSLTSIGFIKEEVNVEFPLKLKAIDMLKKGTCTNDDFLNIIVSKKLSPLKTEKAYIPFDNDGNYSVRVNGSQISAIEKALNVEDLLLIQGPPGTGKTTIITEMVKNFVKNGLRVLVCSKNNLAVDNVLEKCGELYYDGSKTKKMQCLRLGDPDSVLPSVKKYLPRSLALSIQNNVKASSKKAYDRYAYEEAENCERYKKAYKDTHDICELLKLFVSQKTVYKKASNAFSRNILSFVLLSRRKKTIAQLKAILDSLDALISFFVSLLEKREISQSEEQIKKNVQLAETALDRIIENAAELERAKRRYMLVLGETGKEMLLLSKNAKENKHRFLFDIETAFKEYVGNIGNDAFDFDRIRKNEIGASFVEDFREAIRASINKAETALVVFKSIMDEWHNELLNDQQVLETPLIQCAKIIGATCIGVNTTPGFSNSQYDVAIVDEAGQIALHDLFVPLIKAKKVILIGDHVQLAPAQKDEFCDYLEQQDLLGFEDISGEEERKKYLQSLKNIYSSSLFEQLFLDKAFDNNKIMLDTQFRMNPVIAEFVSQNFYGGKYRSGVTKEERSLNIAGFDKPMYFIDTAFCANRFEDKRENKNEHSNSLEAKICAHHISEIIIAIENGKFTGAVKSLKNENGDYDIGVITAYSYQKQPIETLIRNKLTKCYEEDHVAEIMAHITVNTLDSFQGRDNQIIFYSFVRSNPENNIGFLNDIRRINVMMTRAKSLLVMVGDSNTFKRTRATAVHNGERARDFYARLVDYCRSCGGYIEIKNEADYE